jgi:hypothetical protein
MELKGRGEWSKVQRLGLQAGQAGRVSVVLLPQSLTLLLEQHLVCYQQQAPSIHSNHQRPGWKQGVRMLEVHISLSTLLRG